MLYNLMRSSSLASDVWFICGTLFFVSFCSVDTYAQVRTLLHGPIQPSSDGEPAAIGPSPQRGGEARARNDLRRFPLTTEQRRRQFHPYVGTGAKEAGPVRMVRTASVAARDSKEELTLPAPSQDGRKTADDQLVWWQAEVQNPLFRGKRPVDITLSSLLVSALQHSAQIDVFKDMPIIKEMEITQADAAFDWTPFIRSTWRDISEPNGSLLQTNQPRYEDRNFTAEVGIRRRTTLGSELKIGNQIGLQNTNSPFFDPNNQGTARLTVSLTQPLLRGAGKIYNTSFTLLAQIRAAEARDEFSRDLQAQLLDVTRYYWELYLARGNLLQKKRLLVRAKEIHDALKKRREIDTVSYQIQRAYAAVKTRQSDIANAVRQVLDAEAKLRTSVNAPILGQSGRTELIPSEQPWVSPFPVTFDDSVQHALRNRPEIRQAMKRVKQAGVRMKVAENELLPMLDFIMESYAAGLRGNNNISGGYVDAFSEGRPSYTVGLRYEIPYGNRAARARYDQRRAELRQLEKQIRATIERVKLEVELAVNNTSTTYREIDAKTDAVRAEARFVQYLTDRWKLLPGQNQQASSQLEDLLEAHERLTQAEFELLSTQLTYSLSQMTYKQATGILLESENISIDRFCECYLPAMSLNRRE